MSIHFKIAGYHFAPRWTMVVLTILGLLVFLSLGIWQLQRAEQKREILTAYQQRAQSADVSLAAVIALAVDEQRYHPVKVRGSFDNQHQFLLDNKIEQGQVGYQVLTPFIPAQGQGTDAGRLLLVNRGWVPRGQERSILPQLPSILGPQVISGLVYLPPSSYVLKQTLPEPGWPKRVQTLELASFATELQHPLYPFVVLLDASSPQGFVRHWQPAAVTSPEKHVAYAVQWFLFALIALGLFLRLNFTRIPGHRKI